MMEQALTALDRLGGFTSSSAWETRKSRAIAAQSWRISGDSSRYKSIRPPTR
jgi:hypothetical protein